MSSHETLTTGCRPRPHPGSLGRYWQPDADTQASHSAYVTSNRPAANALAIVTQCCGPSTNALWLSSAGEPIVNAPAGTTTISGQVSQSLNVSFAARQRMMPPTTDCTPGQLAGTARRLGGCVTSSAMTMTAHRSGAAALVISMFRANTPRVRPVARRRRAPHCRAVRVPEGEPPRITPLKARRPMSHARPKR